MKPGDMVWVRVEYRGTDENGEFYHQPDARSIITDHPAMPAVARWLAEHSDALRYGQHTPGDWLDVAEAAFDEQEPGIDRMVLQDQVIPALRALLAALTQMETE